eukprot:CAMPEP_0113845500 /NCGR_PEP_ID=MMETSP0372-20130328/791_1 /TAXON_ID=340204 /ORGANISM="Lankesteria abbotti" /LENGTH=248 /DNA_ID=CAMNT_0000814549 /DNA_START=645 /DNA_END=1391 /DNA_ORIENTATION=+ /assembly_acc=CAM_ASM_000359
MAFLNPPLWNGSIVKILDFNTSYVEVQQINTTNPQTIHLKQQTFPVTVASTCTLRRKQLPLSYAGATTIHDVQAMTVDRLYASLDRIFSKSLLYVLLSRVRNLSSSTILQQTYSIQTNTQYLKQALFQAASDYNPAVTSMTEFIFNNDLVASTNIGFSRDVENRVKSHSFGRFKKTKDVAAWSLFFVIVGFNGAESSNDEIPENNQLHIIDFLLQTFHQSSHSKSGNPHQLVAISFIFTRRILRITIF